MIDNIKYLLSFYFERLSIILHGGILFHPKDFPIGFDMVKIDEKSGVFAHHLLKIIVLGKYNAIVFNTDGETLMLGNNGTFSLVVNYNGTIIQSVHNTDLLGSPIIQQHIEPVKRGVYKLVSMNYLANLHWELLFNSKGEKLSDFKYIYHNKI